MGFAPAGSSSKGDSNSLGGFSELWVRQKSDSLMQKTEVFMSRGGAAERRLKLRLYWLWKHLVCCFVFVCLQRLSCCFSSGEQWGHCSPAALFRLTDGGGVFLIIRLHLQQVDFTVCEEPNTAIPGKLLSNWCNFPRLTLNICKRRVHRTLCLSNPEEGGIKMFRNYFFFIHDGLYVSFQPQNFWLFIQNPLTENKEISENASPTN